MSQLSVLDFIFIGIILIFVIRGCIKGFIDEFFGLGAFLISIFLGIQFFPMLQKSFSFNMIPLLKSIISFLLIFVLSFLVIKLFQAIIKNIFSGKILGSLDHALGILFGFAEGIIFVLAFIVIVTALVPFIPPIKDTLNESVFYDFYYGIVAMQKKILGDALYV